MEIVWWAMSGSSIFLYICLVHIVLPRAFFKVRFNIESLRDRGVVNYRKRSGRVVLYETQADYKKYICQYLLSRKYDKTILLCKIDEKIADIDYNVRLFDAQNKPFDTINVKENICTPGYTRETELPARTSFVSIDVNAVNGEKLPHTVKTQLALGRRTKFFAAITLVLSVLEAFFIKLCIAKIFADVFIWGFWESLINAAITAGFATVLAGVNFVFVFVHLRNKKKREQL